MELNKSIILFKDLDEYLQLKDILIEYGYKQHIYDELNLPKNFNKSFIYICYDGVFIYLYDFNKDETWSTNEMNISIDDETNIYESKDIIRLYKLNCLNLKN